MARPFLMLINASRKEKEMKKGNIEYEPIYVTKATREAVRGVAELDEMSEEDLVHVALAFLVGRKIETKLQVVLRGESVEEDFETLKSAWTTHGSKMYGLFPISGDKDRFQIQKEALSRFHDWRKGQKDVATDNNPFELFYKNLSYEQEWVDQITQKCLEVMQGEETSEELNTEAEAEKYRKERGYLWSEIPLGFCKGGQASLDPEIRHLLELGQKILSNQYSLEDIVAFFAAWKVAKVAIKGKLVEVLGEDRVKKIWNIIRSRFIKLIDRELEKWSDDENSQSGTD